MISSRRKLSPDRVSIQIIQVACLLLLFLVLVTAVLKHLPPLIEAAKEVHTSVRGALGTTSKDNGGERSGRQAKSANQ